MFHIYTPNIHNAMEVGKCVGGDAEFFYPLSIEKLRKILSPKLNNHKSAIFCLKSAALECRLRNTIANHPLNPQGPCRIFLPTFNRKDANFKVQLSVPVKLSFSHQIRRLLNAGCVSGP